jgi:PBP1b-binding outer membrane lipoprotein LpoB
MDLYLNVIYLNAFDMKKLLLVIISALFIGACAQKTCPTYSYNDLNTEQESNTEEQSV